jgi:rhomboid protease GluP
VSNKLQQGRVAARVGDRAEARRLLLAATQETPESVEAWLELAGVVEAPEEKRRCFVQALNLAPGHPAAQAGLFLVEQKLAGQGALAAPGLAAVSPAGTQIFCQRHPQIETGLRCNRCETPICPKCAQRTPVGFRCPNCVTELEGRYYSQLKDGEVNPYHRPLHQPFVNYLLIGLLALGWFSMEAAGGSTTDEVLINFGANYGPLILQGEIWRLFTSMFLHIGLQHLVFNLVGLLAFGFEMERLYGRYRYLTIYLLSGLLGNLLSFTLQGPNHYSAGASGAIYGIVGTNLAFFWLYRHKLGEYGRQRRNFVLILVGVGLVLGLTAMPADNLAHIGGFLAGTLLGYALAPRYRVNPAGPQQIIDRAALTRRWWVPTLGLMTFGGGLWLALSFWLATAGKDLRHSFPDPIDERHLEYGRTVETHLGNEDGDIWTFEGKTGQIITIAMNSDSFDTYLELYAPGNAFLVEDDDSGRRKNAKIKAFQLPASGTYTLIAYSVEDRGHLGSPYSLTITLLGRGDQAYQPLRVLQSHS